jgi:hypothetical protein
MKARASTPSSIVAGGRGSGVAKHLAERGHMPDGDKEARHGDRASGRCPPLADRSASKIGGDPPEVCDSADNAWKVSAQQDLPNRATRAPARIAARISPRYRKHHGALTRRGVSRSAAVRPMTFHRADARPPERALERAALHGLLKAPGRRTSREIDTLRRIERTGVRGSKWHACTLAHR